MATNNRHATAHTSLLLWCLIALPVAIHFALLWLYAVNAPRLDDFSEILTFLPDWHATISSDEKLAVFFRDYQNHRYVLYHFFLVLFDHINFRTAAIAGNLPLIALCALMMKCVATHPHKKILWLITPLLVFNLQTWRAMFWGPLGTTNLLYPTIALLACWLATLNTHGVIAAALAATFLTLSHGSGPILFPVIAVYLWMQIRTGRYTSNIFIGWISISVLVLLLYFVAFPLQREAGYSSHSSMELLQNFFAHTSDILQGFLALLGSHLLINDIHQPWQNTLAIVLGAIELLWLISLLARGALREYPALLLWLTFLLLTVASIASGRVSYAGIDQAMQGHYKLLNSIMLWFVVITTLQWLDKKYPADVSTAAFVAVSLAAMLYVGALLFFMAPMKTHQQALIDDVRQWQQSGKLDNIETRLYVKQHNLKLKTAIEGGFYDP
jgi:hypothetical protein